MLTYIIVWSSNIVYVTDYCHTVQRPYAVGDRQRGTARSNSWISSQIEESVPCGASIRSLLHLMKLWSFRRHLHYQMRSSSVFWLPSDFSLSDRIILITIITESSTIRSMMMIILPVICDTSIYRGPGRQFCRRAAAGLNITLTASPDTCAFWNLTRKYLRHFTSLEVRLFVTAVLKTTYSSCRSLSFYKAYSSDL